MGYTHYFSFMKAPKGRAGEAEKRYQLALIECAKVVKFYNKIAVGNDRLSGYTAHTKTGSYGGLNVNGKESNAHEDFNLREHFNENGFGFCKTARKPYDIVVTACLLVLKYRLRSMIDISSDGRISDWELGLELAKKVLKRKLTIPNTIRNNE